jgi:redox-sensitive bicupin YhaK (pirin superfamily)
MTVHRSDLFDLDAIVLSPISDLGAGVNSRRALPSLHRRVVGGFIFLDHLGPRVLEAGHGFDM